MKKLGFIIIALLCTTCQQPAGKPITVQKPASPTVQNLSDSLILTLLFGQAVKQHSGTCCQGEGAFQACAKADSTKFTTSDWEALAAKDSLCYRVERTEEIKEDSVVKSLVLLSADGTSCHICPGVCGAAVFVKKGDAWVVERFNPAIAVFGVVGSLGSVEVFNAGLENYAIILKNGSIWQGVGYQYFTIVMYQKGIFSNALDESITYSSDNWSNAQQDDFGPAAYGYTSNISFDYSKKPVWDMILHYQGTILKGDRARLLDKRVRFEYKNGKYQTNQKLPDES